MSPALGNGAVNGEHLEPVAKEPEKQGGWSLGALFRGITANGEALKAISVRLDVLETKMDLILARLEVTAAKVDGLNK